MRRFTRLCVAVLAALGLLLGAVAFANSASAYPPGKNPSIKVNKSCGPVGTQVVVTGQNFNPRETVTLTYHSTPIPLGTVTTTAGGTFNTKVTIPSDTAGVHAIFANGVSTEVASAAFTAPCPGSGSAGGSGGNGGGLGNTGVAVIGISGLGLVLLVAGGLFLLASRRRRASV